MQQNISIEENIYDMVAAPTESKKSSYLYHSLAKTEKLPTSFDVTKTIADLRVSPIKVEYTCSFDASNDAAGRKAAINYAITQALKINGNGDVLLDPKYEIQAEDGRVKSVRVSGYAATYCNFRTATMEDLKMLKEGNGNTQIVPQTPKQD